MDMKEIAKSMVEDWEKDTPIEATTETAKSNVVEGTEQPELSSDTASQDSKVNEAKTADTPAKMKQEFPSSVNKADDKVKYAFMKERNRRKKAEEMYRSLMSEMEQLKKQIGSKSVSESIDDKIKLANIQGKMDTLEQQDNEATMNYETERDSLLASKFYNEEQMKVYNADVAPYRAQLLSELKQHNPIVARYVQSSDCAPLLLTAFRSRKAFEYLDMVDSPEPMRVWSNMNSLVELLKSEHEGSKVKETKPKITTPSVNENTTHATEDDGDWAKMLSKARKRYS